MDHPSLMRILEYVAGKAAEEDGFRLDLHLAACPECAARARAYRLLRDHRAAVFSARHTVDPALAQLRKRLRSYAFDAEIPSEVERRLLRWSRNLMKSTSAALRIGLQSAARLAWIRDEALPRMTPAGPLLAFEPVAPPIRVRGKDRRGPAMVESPDEPMLRVVADAAESAVTVRHPKGAAPHPFVVLIATSSEFTRVAQLAAVPGEAYLLARFEDVPDGEYTLLLQAPARGQIRSTRVRH
ncbi:hypothetical protein JXA88_09290 [Candidatus Fermentibacteria bacterium]|nr:hypothetical protein [Candidatus Fermentibacteria bacterium]